VCGFVPKPLKPQSPAFQRRIYEQIEKYDKRVKRLS